MSATIYEAPRAAAKPNETVVTSTCGHNCGGRCVVNAHVSEGRIVHISTDARRWNPDHPPLPACAVCGSLDWDTLESSGRGTLYSYVVVHYPQVPAFEYPLPIGLILLEEGTRVVANLEGIAHDAIEIGMALRAEFVDYDEDLSLPVFVPAAGAGAGSGAGSAAGAGKGS